MKNRLNRLRQQRKNIEKEPYKTCFGTKKFFKSRNTTYIDNVEEWKKEWFCRRHKNFTITGSKNHEGGSMCCRYDTKTGNLMIMKHTRGKLEENKKYEKQEWFEIPCKFMYRQEELFEALEKKDTVAYQIEDKGEYYIIKAVFDIEKDKSRINDYIGEGIIAIDINVDCYALANIDKKGNILNSKVISFNLKGLSSNQSTKLLEKKALEVVDYCKKYKKPLVREDIKNIKYKNTKSKKTNYILSTFAYQKMIETIDRCCYNNDYGVYKINPSYTSQLGKIKYMRRYGLSIHQSAAFCIGRRFLFSKEGKIYYEKLKKYEHFGSIKSISKEFSKLNRKYFYKLDKENFKIKAKDYKKCKNYVKDLKEYFDNKKLNLCY